MAVCIHIHSIPPVTPLLFAYSFHFGINLCAVNTSILTFNLLIHLYPCITWSFWCLLKIIYKLSFNSFTFQKISSNISCNPILVYVGTSGVRKVNVTNLLNISDVIHSRKNLFMEVNSNAQ